MAIFNSYVSLPEGIAYVCVFFGICAMVELHGLFSLLRTVMPPVTVGHQNCFLVGKRPHVVLPKPGIMVNKRNHPKMAELFRLVNYYNFPRLDRQT